jgi:RNA polymerase sigma factor (sigma-70 family)
MSATTDGSHSARTGRPRPDDEQVYAAAVELVTTGSGSFRRTARRYSMCGADADDAYQRSLEILLTKAPTASRAELRPWLHTVIKHEALAVRRQRERTVATTDDPSGDAAMAAPERGPEETASRRERAHRTAEALGALKPSELQCLILKALGYSYEEISHRTGFSWTKVNRSLTEGRRRFFECFGQIASGDRCDHFRPLLSAVCDGHASAEQKRDARAHLSSCQGCRAALRAYRSAPGRLAELVPPSIVLPLLERGGLWSRVADWFSSGGGERAGALGAKLQQGAEMVSAQKAAVVVASTAAIAGGGAAVHQEVRGLPDRERPARVERASTEQEIPPASPQAQADPAPDPTQQPASSDSARDARAETAPAAEFSLEEAAASSPDPSDHTEEFGGAPGGSSTPGAGGGEFGP